MFCCPLRSAVPFRELTFLLFYYLDPYEWPVQRDWFKKRAPFLQLLGTLRSEDGDGRKNFAEKVNPRSFNLHRDYSKSLTLSNVGEPS